MKESTGIIQLIRDIVASTTTFPIFLVTCENTVLQVEASQEALGGNPDGVKIILRQGRELALKHPQIRRNGQLQVIQIMLGSTAEGESVIASMIDKRSGKMHAIPYLVVRDRKGKVINLIDTGGIIQIAGTFLYAFLIGVNTSDQSEQYALKELDREMERLAKEFVREAKKRLGGLS